ncbi:MAG: hypothetical protein K8R52_02105 [Bacteroidales bacterium]|nr:hypothetical protein [Bacteroidales bacterium]
MKSYDELRKICERTSRISGRVVDDYLIHYAAGHRGLEKKMEQQFDRYRHVGRKMGKEVVNMLKSQYLAHKIFRQEGLLGRFLKHPALDRFTGEERDYLMQQHKLPWRFSFSVIVDQPAEDFFMMQDVFTGKQFLLFSPGVSNIMASGSPILWFNLIGFNGSCWQSYGPVVYYNSFEAGDIWFYATELNPDLEEPAEVMADVDLDPVPYMMLVSGANYPLTFHKEDQLLFLLAEHDLPALDTAGLKKVFKTGYDKGVYRISHKQWGEHPHFAEAYFDEHKHLLLFSAMTDRGFAALIKAFNTFGHDFPTEPYLRVNMTMVTTAGEILKRKIVLNEYLDLFQEESDPAKEKVLEDINAFIALVLPDINAGVEPDIEEAARKTGVDPETAHSVVESVLGSLDSVPGKMPELKKQNSAGKKQAASTKKQAVSKKLQPASKHLPMQTGEGIRLLTSDDKLLFGLHIYRMAGDIRRMAPWDYLYENEVFGVQMPGTDLVYYVSVMGNEGEFQALSFYKGHEGLIDFLEFGAEVERLSRQGLSGENMLRTSTMIGGPMTIPHLMLSFANREDLGKEDLTAIKKCGISFRGKGQWPMIEEIVPGYFPVYPGRETQVELFLVMQQALIVLEKARENDAYLQREGDPDETILIRIPTGKGPRFRWKDHYLVPDPGWGEVSYSVDISADTRDALSRFPEASQELQVDLFMLPAPVKEKGQKAFFPFVLMLVDKVNSMVTGMSMLTPQPDLQTMFESIPQRALDELIKSGHRPSKIEIRSDLLFELLEEILKKAGCRVVWVDRMTEMDEVIGSMVSNMS